MQKLKFYILGLSFNSLLLLSSCGDDDTNTTVVPPTLFDELGGVDGIATVVDRAVMLIGADDGQNGIADHFEIIFSESATEQAAFRQSITDFLGELTGGDVDYTGADMTSAHDVNNPRMNGLVISDTDFTRFVTLVGDAAEDEGVSSENIASIAAALEQFRNAIVGSLFQDLGGRTAIRTVVNRLIVLIATDTGDEGIAGDFEVILSAESEDQEVFANNITDFLSVATGATSVAYNGPTLEEAHDVSSAGMNGNIISNSDFARFNSLVHQAMIESGVSLDNAARVLAVLNSTEGQIVSTVFEDLGGTVAIEAVVGTLIAKLTTDTEAEVGLAPFFAVALAESDGGNTTGVEALTDNLVNYLSVAAGDTDAIYEGLSMTAAHDPTINDRMTGLVTDEAYTRFLDFAEASVIENNVSEEIAADLIAILERDRAAIVQN